MSLRDTPNHEKTRRMGGAKRNPSALFVAELPARAGKRIDQIMVHSPVKERDEFHLYEDCNECTDHLRVDAVLRLALGKEFDSGVGISYDFWTFGIPRAFSDGI